MLTIDKAKATNTLVVTVSELTTIDNPFYLLVISSLYTNTVHRIQLPENLSESQIRYDEFVIGSVFNNVDAGMYNYAIYQSAVQTYDENALGEPVEIGFLRVLAPVADEYVSLPVVDVEDNYLVYKSN